jgi:hypothetical protein
MCKRVKVADNWNPRDGVITKDVSHTYCPDCLKATTVAMAAEVRSADHRKLRFSGTW